MYDWQPEILTQWEQDVAPNFTRQQYHALLPIEKIEVKIAFAKVSVNIAIEKLRTALKALPWPPHEVQLWTRATHSDFGVLIDGVMDARQINEDLRQIYFEDHPEYSDYYAESTKLSHSQAALEMYRNQIEKIKAAVLKKKRKKTANVEL